MLEVVPFRPKAGKCWRDGYPEALCEPVGLQTNLLKHEEEEQKMVERRNRNNVCVRRQLEGSRMESLLRDLQNKRVCVCGGGVPLGLRP